MIPKIIDDQKMQRMTECRVRFVNCVWLFISPAIYKSASDKKIAISGSVLQSLIHFHNASTDAVHHPRLPL